MLYPTLDQIVLETIDLYVQQADLPQLDLSGFQTPLVVGSGNGYYTGRILFRNLGAFFATESEVGQKLANIVSITDVIVISASGEKHAPIILNIAKEYSKNTFLISSSQKSSGRDIAGHTIVMPRVREPYTYNTSTYFGYMLAETPDLDLVALREFITDELTDALSFPHFALDKLGGSIAQDPIHTGTDPGLPHRQDDRHGAKINFNHYSSFVIVIPNQFVLLREMFETKFIELFGRRVARDIFAYEQMKHATTVVQDDKELFLCFGNTTGIQYGKNQIDLPIFDSVSYAAMMLVGYYVIGKIQSSLPPYFMESIAEYCKRAKVQSGFNISPWVEV